ncbi:MAG: FAD-dependent oxidoreductase [Methylococcales bacterium]|nr:FAD-dependent oxidoreductase [Methylococcales bacterium]
MQRKNKITKQLSEQIKTSFNHHGVEYIHANGRLLNSTQVTISPLNGDKDYIVEAKHIILATGSKSIEMDCAKIDNEFILDSNAILDLESVPKKMGIIGAGIIGLELAGIWNRLGSKVVLLEAQENFLIAPDFQISREAYKLYTQQGLDLRLGARVMGTKKNG